MEFDRRILDVIEKLNQTVLKPETWFTALTDAVSFLNGDHAILFTNRTSATTNPFGVFPGLGEQDVRRFFSPAGLNFLKPLEKIMTPGRLVPLADHFSEREFEGTEFFNEVVRPVNGFHSVSVQQDRPDLAFHFSICRPRSPGPFTAADMRNLEVLLPHMTFALQLRHRMQIGEYQSRGFSEALGRMNEGAIVLDRSNRLLIVNPRAARILEQGDGLSFAAGQLRASTKASSAKLHEVIAAASVSTANESQPLYLPRPSPQLPLLLSVVPIWRLQTEEPGAGAPSVLIFIREPDAQRPIDRTALEDVFRLTPRESEIAALLADGATARMIATRLDLTIGTVRFNLKRIFRKTDTHSQAALVALIRNFNREQR